MSEEKGRFYYKQNRIKKLAAFCMTAKTGSVSQAAEKLFLSQPTISLQIQALERDMKVALFERRGPKIMLTPEGAVLYQMAQPLVDGIAGLEDNFKAVYGKLDSGVLNIAAGESTTLYILPEFVKRFATLYPGIDIKLHNVTGRDGMAMLRADEADLAVGSMMDVPDDVIYQEAKSYDQMLITPLDHPLARLDKVTLEDICPYGLILPPRHLATWRFLEWVFSRSGLKFQVAMEAGGYEIIKKYVALGLGISIVSGLCLAGDEELFQTSMSEYIPNRSYGVVVRRGKFLTPQAREFITMIKPTFFANRGTGSIVS